MRATWPGARSGRIAITTGPLVVSRRSVLPAASALSVMVCPFCLDELAVVDEAHGHRSPGESIAERVGEVQRHAAFQRLSHGGTIRHPFLVGRFRRLIGDARLAE